jgi:hypothetical protein
VLDLRRLLPVLRLLSSVSLDSDLANELQEELCTEESTQLIGTPDQINKNYFLH